MTYVIPQWRFGDRLRRAREEAGIEQGEMAQRIGVSAGAVSQWESNRSKPRNLIPVVKRWAAECSVPWEWLVDDEFVSSLWTTEHPDHPLLAATG